MNQSNRMRLLTVNVVNGTRERDMLSSNFVDGMMLKRSYGMHKITVDEVGRPDLVAWREYGSSDLWWLILKVNGIVDPIAEMKSGHLLIIPNLLDFSEYYDRYKK